MKVSIGEFNLYIIVAAATVGKGALMTQMMKEGFWKLVPKYSTRDNRNKDGKDDDDVVKIDNYK
jgi:guanylate kinase